MNLHPRKLNIPGVEILKKNTTSCHKISEILTEVNSFNKGDLHINLTKTKILETQRNDLKGLYYQVTKPVEQILSVISGRIFIALVDLRYKSQTFSKNFTIELSNEPFSQIYIPAGVAYGYCTCSKNATVSFQYTELYDENDQAGIKWNSVNIIWPINNPIISQKDESLPDLKNSILPYNHLFYLD